jgi:hypothetical protein
MKSLAFVIPGTTGHMIRPLANACRTNGRAAVNRGPEAGAGEPDYLIATALT